MGEVIDLGKRRRYEERLAAQPERTMCEPMRGVIRAVVTERARQVEKWGSQDHVDPHEWLAILMEEVGEAAKPVADSRVGHFRVGEYREELIQVAAVAVAAIEAIDKQQKENQ